MGGPLRIKSETIKAKTYPLMREAVEAGIAYGYHRAFKHTNTPEPQAIMDEIEQAVMNEIAARFTFSDDFE